MVKSAATFCTPPDQRVFRLPSLARTACGGLGNASSVLIGIGTAGRVGQQITAGTRRQAVAAPSRMRFLQHRARIRRHEPADRAVLVHRVIDDDAERAARGQRIEDAWIVRVEQHAHRVFVRRRIAAESVVERNRIERLLIQRGGVVVFDRRQIEPRRHARRRRPVLGLGAHAERGRPPVERAGR